MSNYASPHLRSILTESYNDEELGFLCFDYFRVVYRQFTNGMTLGQKVQLLLEYCEQHRETATLVTLLQQQRPDRFPPAEQIQPPETTAPQPTPAPGSKTLPPAPNPFGWQGRIDAPAIFFDRELLLHTIFEELERGCNLSLVGEAQVGKSSLLAMIAALGPTQLTMPTETFLSIDMQIIYDENDFFEALCCELEIETCRGFKLWRKLQGKRYILCMDEIEKMRKDRFSGDEREELRGLADGANAPLTLVIASRVSLDELFPDAKGQTSPLANICTPLHVPPFTPEVAQRFIEERLQGTGVMFSAAQINQLVLESGGHPARLQQAAAELYRAVIPQTRFG